MANQSYGIQASPDCHECNERKNKPPATHTVSHTVSQTVALAEGFFVLSVPISRHVHIRSIAQALSVVNVGCLPDEIDIINLIDQTLSNGLAWHPSDE